MTTEKIIIWDNGGEYSDHSIQFIKEDIENEDDIKKIESALKLNVLNNSGHIIMVVNANNVEWWAGGMTRINYDNEDPDCRGLLNIVDLFEWTRENGNVFRKEEAESLGRVFIKKYFSFKDIENDCELSEEEIKIFKDWMEEK